jgi:hypothetical protein
MQVGPEPTFQVLPSRASSWPYQQILNKAERLAYLAHSQFMKKKSFVNIAPEIVVKIVSVFLFAGYDEAHWSVFRKNMQDKMLYLPFPG